MRPQSRDAGNAAISKLISQDYTPAPKRFKPRNQAGKLRLEEQIFVKRVAQMRVIAEHSNPNNKTQAEMELRQMRDAELERYWA